MDAIQQTGVKWYFKSAAQGFAKAQFDLGHMYKDGFGVKQDIKKSVDWFNKAAKQGYLNAKVALGNMYIDGEIVEKGSN